jgi:hypothetical protein
MKQKKEEKRREERERERERESLSCVENFLKASLSASQILHSMSITLFIVKDSLNESDRN